MLVSISSYLFIRSFPAVTSEIPCDYIIGLKSPEKIKKFPKNENSVYIVHNLFRRAKLNKESCAKQELTRSGKEVAVSGDIRIHTSLIAGK